MTRTLLLSASLLNRYLSCPKQAAFSLEPQLKNYNKTTPSAALGSVVHKVLELSARNPVNWDESTLMDWFEKKWMELLFVEYENMQNEWKPNHVLNPYSWRGLYKAKAAARTLVTKNSGIRPSRTAIVESFSFAERSEGEVSFPFVEKYLVDPVLRIHGKLDYVTLEDGKATIIDYKFGRDQLFLDAHKLQMHFYVILLESVTKFPVEKCVIVTSANREQELPIDRVYIAFLLEEFSRVLKALETRKVLAYPSNDNCQFCAFKIKCTNFRNSNLRTPSGHPLIISGIILQVSKMDNKYQEVLVHQGDGLSATDFRIFRVPFEYPLEIGKKIHVYGNLYFHSGFLVEFQWNSTLEVEA